MYAALEFYKIFIPLRDKIEAGADLVRTITSLCKGAMYLRKGEM